jgi:branched-chain amino acid transport system permease protein
VANWGAAAALVTAVVALFDEVNAYRLGFVAIVFVAAIGLHILVNWAGELSLAHAGMIGLPAFLVAQLATHTGVSTILLLPAGVVIGAALGLLIAIPARRARGLHVALVTLAVAIAVEQFFFNRSWVIGPPSGLSVGHPELFGVEFRTNRSLLPVLAAVVVIAVVAGRSLLASTVGRALAFMRANPDAAAAAGIPVASYRSAVYGVAGAFAGLAGAMYVMWVQHVTPQAFPLNLSFTYLVLAVLAGNGGLSGVAFSALALEGGRLFLDLGGLLAYLGPIALIVNVTKYEEGLNGALRISREHTAALVRSLAHRRGRPMTGMTEATGARRARVPVVLATMAIVAGFASIALAWYHMGNTSQTWVQNQEFVSGGIGGLGLIIVGCTILITDALLRAREEPDAVAGPMVVAEGTVVRSAAEGGRRRRTPTAAEAR